jgi:hypothetical protein
VAKICRRYAALIGCVSRDILASRALARRGDAKRRGGLFKSNQFKPSECRE